MAGASGDQGQPHKPHRSRQSGPSVKKKSKDKKKDLSEGQNRNPKVDCFVIVYFA